MDQSVSNNENLINRIQQLEHERDELRKDIEQLCLQQAGPTYLAAATRMHFQRTAGLEQEIESLKKKLAACTRDNLNLQEELSEVYHIKSQLADLHSAEVSKNLEAEKQVKFFQSSVAAAFAERDNAIMEVEKAQEREEAMTRTLNESEEKVKELTSDLREAKELCASLQIDIMKLIEQNENFKKVITKFYAIRESSSGFIEDMQLESQCECLLQDAPEMWSFVNHAETSTADYTLELEKELDALRNYVDNLQNKLRMGLEIEDHLKKKVHKLEKKEILSDNLIRSKIWKLRDFYAKHKSEVIDLLEQQKTQFKSMLDIVEEQTKRAGVKRTHNFELSDAKFSDNECRDVNVDPDSNVVTEENVPPSPNKVTGKHDTSDALAQALNEKVAALLLLSQQEERHLLDRNVNAALQMKLEELQRNLLQVTNEKVMALMELSRLRSIIYGMKQRNARADIGVIGNSAQESGGKLRSLLKKTHLSNWIGRLDSSGNETSVHLSNNEGSAINVKSNFPEDFARIKIENATLRESIESMVHLTTTIHRLRLSLLKAKDSKTSSSRDVSIIEALDDIISEAKLVKMALGSSLPASWSLDAESGGIVDELIDGFGELDYEKLDAVTAAGFEMVELVILAAQFLKESITNNDSNRDDS